MACNNVPIPQSILYALPAPNDAYFPMFVGVFPNVPDQCAWAPSMLLYSDTAGNNQVGALVLTSSSTMVVATVTGTSQTITFSSAIPLALPSNPPPDVNPPPQLGSSCYLAIYNGTLTFGYSTTAPALMSYSGSWLAQIASVRMTPLLANTTAAFWMFLSGPIRYSSLSPAPLPPAPPCVPTAIASNSATVVPGDVVLFLSVTPGQSCTTAWVPIWFGTSSTSPLWVISGPTGQQTVLSYPAGLASRATTLTVNTPSILSATASTSLWLSINGSGLVVLGTGSLYNQNVVASAVVSGAATTTTVITGNVPASSSQSDWGISIVTTSSITNECHTLTTNYSSPVTFTPPGQATPTTLLFSYTAPSASANMPCSPYSFIVFQSSGGSVVGWLTISANSLAIFQNPYPRPVAVVSISPPLTTASYVQFSPSGTVSVGNVTAINTYTPSASQTGLSWLTTAATSAMANIGTGITNLHVPGSTPPPPPTGCTPTALPSVTATLTSPGNAVVYFVVTPSTSGCPPWIPIWFGNTTTSPLWLISGTATAQSVSYYPAGLSSTPTTIAANAGTIARSTLATPLWISMNAAGAVNLGTGTIYATNVVASGTVSTAATTNVVVLGNVPQSASQTDWTFAVTSVGTIPVPPPPPTPPVNPDRRREEIIIASVAGGAALLGFIAIVYYVMKRPKRLPSSSSQ